MAFTIDRCCLACRRMIPAESGVELVSAIRVTTEFKEKTGKLTAKIKAGPIDTLCADCTAEFLGLIKEQKAKGMKVL